MRIFMFHFLKNSRASGSRRTRCLDARARARPRRRSSAFNFPKLMEKFASYYVSGRFVALGMPGRAFHMRILNRELPPGSPGVVP